MDPHCGWCFGYSTTISEIRKRIADNDSIDFDVIPGGLFIPGLRGSTEFADEKRPVASRIERMFDVEFSPDYFENVLAAPWLDSTPSNQAIHACNIIEPARALRLSSAIIDAAFIDGRDISQPQVVLEIAQEQGFDRDHFGETMASPTVKEDLGTALRFSAEARSGFPSVFIHDNGRNDLVHLGGANLSVDAFVKAVETRI